MGSVENDRPLIVDTHLHLWDKSKVAVSWTNDAPLFDRNFLLSQYADDVKEWNVRALYMEVNADETAKNEEVAYVDELIARSNLLEAGIYFGDPISPAFQDWVDGLPVNAKGIRQVLHLPESPSNYCLQDRFIDSMHALGDRDMTFDLCLNASDLSDAVILAEKCPDTRFVIDHCGTVHADFSIAAPDGVNWVQWRQDLAILGQFPNVYCKLSGLMSSLDQNWKKDDLKPVIGQCMESFDTSRIIVGSDWPICTLSSSASDWYEALHQVVLDLDSDHTASIFSKNAISLYGLNDKI